MTDFVESLASAITVRQLATPIGQSLVFPPSVSQSAALAALDERDFDFAPVADGDHVIGRIGRTDLDGTSVESVETAITPLHQHIIVSAGSPIDRIVEWFINEPFLLVLDGRDVVGLVTVSDLNKQAARTYLYAMVAGFEMALANLLRLRIEDQESILKHCSGDRQRQILSDFEAAGEQEADYVSAMSLSDLLNVVHGSRLAAELGFESRNAWENSTGSLVKFRNQVAHTTKPIVSTNADIAKVKAAIGSLRVLYGAAVEAAERGSTLANV